MLNHKLQQQMKYAGKKIQVGANPEKTAIENEKVD